VSNFPFAGQTLRRPRFGPQAKRILVAEDDAEMRRVVTDTLIAAGHEVHHVADGGTLLVELAQSGRYNWEAVDLVVSDVRMPICSGFRVAEAMRGVRARVRFVLMTAFADEQMRRRARALEVPLLDKPFTMAQLMTCVDEAMRPR
jgi:CheY-like chemotaxis protein